MKPQLIALYSPAPQSGKSTVAEYLCRKHGYVQMSFAAALKEMADKFLETLGYEEGMRARMLYGDLKEMRLPLLGVTPRHVMQTLGTEWGRNCIHVNVWVEMTLARVAASKRPVVIDDLRFPNEFASVRGVGGLLVMVTRPGVERVGAHSSEGQLDRMLFDLTIRNGGTIEQLHEAVDGLLTHTSGEEHAT